MKNGQALTLTQANKNKTANEATPAAPESSPVLVDQIKTTTSGYALFAAYEAADMLYKNAEAALERASRARQDACKAIYDAHGAGPFKYKGNTLFGGAKIRKGHRHDKDACFLVRKDTEATEIE